MHTIDDVTGPASGATEAEVCACAETALAQGEHQRVVRIVAPYLAQHPSAVSPNVLLVRSLLMSDDPQHWKAALHATRVVLAQQPESAEAYRLQAAICQRLGRRDEAERAVRAALVFDNRSEAAWSLLDSVACPPTYWPETLDVVFYAGHPLSATLPLPSHVGAQALGGSESVLLLMARALADRGMQVAVCGNFPAPCIDHGVYCLPLTDFFLLQRYASLPVAIVSRFAQPFLNHFVARRRIFWLHDIVAESYAPVYHQMDAQVDEYWALSVYQQELYQARCGLNPRKFWRTTNAIDPMLFPAPPPLAERVPGRLLYTSRPNRGLAVALQVYARVRQLRPEVSLHICTYTAGALWDDPELGPLRATIESLPGVTVDSVGKAALAQLLREGQLLLYPNTSEAETSCLAAIEAQAAGTPVVTSSRGCLAETVRDGVTGCVVPWSEDTPMLVEALAAAAHRVLADPARWEAMSAAAHQHALRHHAVATIADTWAEHLRG